MKKVYICPTVYIEDMESDVTMINSSKMDTKTKSASERTYDGPEVNILQNDEVVDLDEGGAKNGWGYHGFNFYYDDNNEGDF